MILAVTLNPAIDLTYELAGPLRLGRTNRVSSVAVTPGGKAINVTRVLRHLGRPVHVIGFAGGDRGRVLDAETSAAGIAADWISIVGETRQTVAINDAAAGTVTHVNEPGPSISADEWERLEKAVGAMPSPTAVVLSGSLPPGVPDGAYAQLIHTVSTTGAITVLDTDGRGLLPGVAAGPHVVKPNRDELAALEPAATTGSDTEWLRAAARRLRDRGAGAVVASDGHRGLVAVTTDGAWSARPPEVLGGNPAGAGDACVAGLVAAMLDEQAWPERLRFAAALGAAAVRAPVAGEVGAIDDLLAGTTVESL